MTAVIILIVLVGLLWLIGQGVLLAMLWGQEQRLHSRLDSLARALGLPSELDITPGSAVPRQDRAKPDAPEMPATPSTSAELTEDVTSSGERERELTTDPGRLTFPPPLRRQPPVPPANEPLPIPASEPADDRKALTAHQSGMSPVALDVSSKPGTDHDDGERIQRSGGLPAGSILPDFELRTLDGDQFRRSMLEGKRSVLIFLAIESPGSAAVMESIRSPQVRKRGLPDLVLVVDGGPEPEAVRRWLGRLPKRVSVLLQDETELASVLRVPGTPAAYALDDQSRTRGGLRTGARAVLEAIGIAAAQMTSTARRSSHLTPHAPVTQRSFHGLQVGSKAPELALPLLGGGVWDGSSSRPQLLIFWDSSCPPCGAMHGALLEAAPTWTGFDALVISRGMAEPEEIFGSLQQYVSVALQQGFAVAQRFQLLETPAAIALNPDGTIAKPPAVGASAVLALAQDLQERADRLSATSEEPTPS